MKLQAKIGDFVLYNHHTLCLIAGPKDILEIGTRFWSSKTKEYQKGRFRFVPILKSNWDFIKQINHEKDLWQRAKVGPGIWHLAIRAIFEGKREVY
jgi:hypothetical protein